MILTMDIGNTNIKVGGWDRDDLVFVSRLQTNTQRTQDEYAIALLDILNLNACNLSQFDGAIISSVVPPLSLKIKQAVQAVIKTRRVFLISPGLKTGLDIKIDNPATLGGDMVCAAVAAVAKYPLPCILISMGTATAVAALDSSGSFLGMAVAPGIGLSMEALSTRAAQLPHISLEEVKAVIGTNTVDSMRSGAVYGTASMLDGLICRMREELGGQATVVACGGAAPNIIGHCREDITMDDQLVLEGLKIIYHKNVK